MFVLQMLHCDVIYFVSFVLLNMYYKCVSYINFLLCCYWHIQMIGHLLLNCISVSFIKYIRKCIMFCVVMADVLGEASYT